MIIWGDEVTNFVQANIPGIHEFSYPFSLGVVRDGYLICGVTYDGYQPQYSSICASIVITDKRALTKQVLFSLFHYPFIHLGLNRITCCIDQLNTKSINLCTKLGFTHEGTCRQGSMDKRDLLVFGMLKSECKWIQYTNFGLTT